MLFLIGDLVDVPTNTYADAARTDLEDPDDLTLVVHLPDKTTKTYAWPTPGADGLITRVAKGVFAAAVAAGQGGFWSAVATATGAVTTAEAYSWYVAAEPPYLLPADVRNVLAGTAALTGTAAALSDDDLFDAIFEAQSEVNARLASRYTVPFAADVPPLVINITRDVAAYVATLTYRRGDPIQPGEPVLLRYQRAQALLAQAANGSLALPIADGRTAGSEAGAEPVVVANPVDGDLWSASDFDLRPAPAGAWPAWPW